MTCLLESAKYTDQAAEFAYSEQQIQDHSMSFSRIKDFHFVDTAIGERDKTRNIRNTIVILAIKELARVLHV